MRGTLEKVRVKILDLGPESESESPSNKNFTRNPNKIIWDPQAWCYPDQLLLSQLITLEDPDKKYPLKLINFPYFSWWLWRILARSIRWNWSTSLISADNSGGSWQEVSAETDRETDHQPWHTALQATCLPCNDMRFGYLLTSLNILLFPLASKWAVLGFYFFPRNLLVWFVCLCSLCVRFR
jgi:hypothetical protein